MEAVTSIKAKIGVRAACEALQIPRATYYRKQKPVLPPKARKPSPRSLTGVEHSKVLEVLNQPRFMDLAVPQVHAQLLEEGEYHCSERTMYRVLEKNKQVRERRAQARRPAAKIPRLVATAPGQVWSWDITKIPGPFTRTWFHLYVVLDIYSRYVVAWMLAHRESGALARRMIEAARKREGIERDQLILHADGGPAMKSKTLKEFLADMGIGESHSRPRVSDDNPYSESQFKTLKYHPMAVDHIQSVFHGRSHFRDMFQWYNYEHRHRGLAMLTPATVHFGKIDDVLVAKQASLDAAYLRHPERFPHGPPKAKRPPKEVWINRPSEGTATINSPHAERTAGVKPGEAGERSERRLYAREHSAIILPDGSEPITTEVLQ